MLQRNSIVDVSMLVIRNLRSMAFFCFEMRSSEAQLQVKGSELKSTFDMNIVLLYARSEKWCNNCFLIMLGDFFFIFLHRF